MQAIEVKFHYIQTMLQNRSSDASSPVWLKHIEIVQFQFVIYFMEEIVPNHSSIQYNTGIVANLFIQLFVYPKHYPLIVDLFYRFIPVN